MKKLFFLCVLLSAFSSAQVTLESGRLMKDGQSYKLSDYNQVFQNEEARAYFKKARTNSTVSSIFAGLGGGLVGVGVANAITTKEQTVYVNGQKMVTKQDKSAAWTVVGIGAGVIGVAIPFALAAGKNAEKALAVENGEGTTAFQPYFKLEGGGNGVALSYNF